MKVYEIREEHNGVLKKIDDNVFTDGVLYLTKEDALEVRSHLLWLREQTYKTVPGNLLKTLNEAYPIRIIEFNIEIY